MSAHTKLILLTLFCVFLDLSLAVDTCEECMANDAFCVDETSYYLCMNGKPMKTELITCPEDQVCSKSANICEPKADDNAICGGSSCNICNIDDKYTCVSKTQFGRCLNGKVAVTSSCEKGSLCSTEMLTYGQICAPTCVLDFFGLSATCSNDQPITTTAAPPSTPNVATMKEKCEAKQSDKKIYTVLGDAKCETYIYCEKVGTDIEAILMKCSPGFYDSTKEECVTVKPESCQ
ncbi:uncharacterized protein LOC111681504 [Lucilia cuprina]|uniref:uncharacterized protein LOC111681504 n=1 Tax=Lucilia cuprina TaxID=7375 RepID=UPI001F060A82|nr:uncharacterized protein LOC111681504 [Lucilia cuprina]